MKLESVARAGVGNAEWLLVVHCLAEVWMMGYLIGESVEEHCSYFPDMLETSKGRSSVNLEILQSPTFRMRLRELLSKLEIIIEFLKGRSKIKSARQASSSATTDVSPVSVDIRHVFQVCSR